jgi:hypothetical protein
MFPSPFVLSNHTPSQDQKNRSDKVIISVQKDARATDFVQKTYDALLKQVSDKPIELI